MIKKGLKVKILTGKDKNKEGEVIEINRSEFRAKVKGLNIIKKHVKTTKEKKGGIFEKENFINLSNLAIIQSEKKIKKEQPTTCHSCSALLFRDCVRFTISGVQNSKRGDMFARN